MKTDLEESGIALSTSDATMERGDGESSRAGYEKTGTWRRLVDSPDVTKAPAHVTSTPASGQRARACIARELYFFGDNKLATSPHPNSSHPHTDSVTDHGDYDDEVDDGW